MEIKFNASNTMTVGVELEVQTINPRTGELIPGAKAILNSLKGDIQFKPELFTSTLEINTPVCESIPELEEALAGNIQTLIGEARSNDLDILIAGCHPFANWQQQQITSQERYQNLLHRIQWPVRQFLIFGLHVHVGIGNADEAIYVMNRLNQYLPYLIALSASSPFWNGFETGLASTRIKIFEELPNAGLPYYFADWNNYAELISNLIKSKSIDTIRDVWWDVRPHPVFGTIEVRVCDAMPTLKENLALTTLIYLLVHKFGKEFRENDTRTLAPRWMVSENKWRASRYGLEGQLIINDEGETESIKVLTQKLKQEMVAYALDNEMEDVIPYLVTIDEILKKGPSYLRQREWRRKKPGDYKYIVDQLKRELSENRLLLDD